MTVLVVVNLGVRFVLEICAFAALAYWGYRTGDSLIARIGLAVGAPLAAVSAWALFVAPKAWLGVGPVTRLAVELAVFAAAVAALASLGSPTLAIALTVTYVINKGLLAILGQ